MKFNAIQFIGTQRSGSNLLRLMLDAHEIISAPHPPHLLKTFYPLLSYYGDLHQVEKRAVFVHDMCNWVDANPVPWGGLRLNRDKIIESSTTVIDIFSQIYEARMHHDGAGIWCCKSTFNIKYVDDLESEIRPFYIYLYRDGRDVTASFKKAIVGPKHTYHLAKKWSEEQKAARSFLDTIPENRYITLAYEDILDRPEACIRELCQKLDIIYKPEMLQFYTSNESRRTADSGEMWKNVLKPIMKNNTGKFQTELLVDDIALFERVAGLELDKLGYQRTFKELVSCEDDISAYDEQNRQLQEEARNRASIQDIEKRAAQMLLLQQIHSRLGVDEPMANPV